jgi:Sec-independent protein secretion pathway component TatC
VLYEVGILLAKRIEKQKALKRAAEEREEESKD